MATNTATVQLQRFNENTDTWGVVEIIEDATYDQMRTAWLTSSRRDTDGYYRIADDEGSVYFGKYGDPRDQEVSFEIADW